MKAVIQVRVVKSQNSIDLLKKMQSLPLDVIHFVQTEFRCLYEAYGQPKDISMEKFHTDDHYCGFIVILENGDTLDDLSVIGLPGGFKKTIIEFAEIHNTGERQIYRIIVIFDNDFALTILCEPGINRDAQFEAWLQEESFVGAILPPTGTTGMAAWEVPF